MKIAAIGDLHCTTQAPRLVEELLQGVEDDADVLVMAGDLTNVGMIEEMQILLDGLSGLSLPMLAVVGNHDHESNHNDLLVKMMVAAGIQVLDGNSLEIDGVGFVGTKGFCGGFTKWRVKPFGEPALKFFIQSTIDEIVQLESAMDSLSSSRNMAVLHYAPIKETLEGESPEIYPFLGTSLLGDALDRHNITVAVHGHAHHGSPEGTTGKNIPVYNVARFVNARHTERAYRIIEL